MKIKYGTMLDNIFMTLYSVILGLYFSDIAELDITSQLRDVFYIDKSVIIPFLFYILLLIGNAMLVQAVRIANGEILLKNVYIEITIAIGMMISIFTAGYIYYDDPSKFNYLAFFFLLLLIWHLMSFTLKKLEHKRCV